MSKYDKIQYNNLYVLMRSVNLLILVFLCVFANGNNTEEETELYYYGIEESERGLPLCVARQACAALLQRYWRAPALLRLCRCTRRRRCHTTAPPTRRIELNNRADFQFCQPTNDWPQCKFGDTALVVQTTYDRVDPDEIEDMHHKQIQLTPPKITFNCKCPKPNYWRLKSNTDDSSVRHYQCGFLPLCRTGEFCGNVDNNTYALYQSCLCPKHHMCVHNGGVTHHDISELLYRGKGWKAYCLRTSDEYYDDY